MTDSRRSFLKKGAVASAMGFGMTGLAGAQQGDSNDSNDVIDFGDDLFVEDEAMEAFMFKDAWNPRYPFVIVSDVLDFQPDVPDIRDEVLTDYNTRAIRYLGTNEHVLFFPAQAAALGPYSEEVGFVVDDDFVEDDQVVVDGTPVDQLNDQQLSQIRPTVWAMSRDPQLFDDPGLVRLDFSPIPENQENRVWNMVDQDFDIPLNSSGSQSSGGDQNASGN